MNYMERFFYRIVTQLALILIIVIITTLFISGVVTALCLIEILSGENFINTPLWVNIASPIWLFIGGNMLITFFEE